MLIAGQINKLTVLRKTDIAYVLVDDNNLEVFLHVNDTNHKKLQEGQIVDAFLFYDAKGRLAASLATPLITVSKPAILKVVGKTRGLGVFLNMGISKDLLLSKDYLPFNESLWPTLGDNILVRLENNNRLVAKPLKENEIPTVIGNLGLPQKVNGFVQAIGKVGIFIYTDTGNLVLVKNSNLRAKYRLGEPLEVNVKYLSKAGYEGTLILAKEYVREDDAQMILDYLKKHHGKMPYNSLTDAKTIQDEFSLSKKAFKRALGLLYKDRVIYFEDENTLLTGEDYEQ